MNHAPILAVLLALAPHGRVRPPPGWQETHAAYEARLTSVAQDIAAVASTESDAAALIGIAWHESGFAADVDAGTCYRGPGWESRCDAGRAVSLWQLQDRSYERREKMRASRRLAAKEALRRAKASTQQCAQNEPALRFALYASGSCGHGLRTARELFHAFVKARDLLASKSK